ncbi:MAG: SAM-dependent methyltransferase, partial [Ilumatobacteraceae bacterium]
MPRSASDEIRAAIAATARSSATGTGAISFATFMQLALYGDGGYYSGLGSAGRRGDFITSAEAGPLFGAVIARWLDALWVELGHPSEFTVVEAAAGTGTLARSIRAATPACLDALRYVAVDVSRSQRACHPDWVISSETMPL